MSENVTVDLQMPDGALASATFNISHDLAGASLRLVMKDGAIASESFVGEDLFEATTELRKALEFRGARLLCAASRPQVFPSGMSRSMGGGRKAYVRRIGEPARREDLVDIFEPATTDAVGTVEEQAEFHQRWVESLKQR